MPKKYTSIYTTRFKISWYFVIFAIIRYKLVCAPIKISRLPDGTCAFIKSGVRVLRNCKGNNWLVVGVNAQEHAKTPIPKGAPSLLHINIFSSSFLRPFQIFLSPIRSNMENWRKDKTVCEQLSFRGNLFHVTRYGKCTVRRTLHFRSGKNLRRSHKNFIEFLKMPIFLNQYFTN